MAVLYTIASLLLGVLVIVKLLPVVRKAVPPQVSPGLLIIPAGYIIGTLILTTGVYCLVSLGSYLGLPNALAWANGISLGGVGILIAFNSKKIPHLKYWHHLPSYLRRRFKTVDPWLALACVVFASVLMFHTVSGQGNSLFLGHSVYGDMNAHIPLIRSFSTGSNFPSSYPFFAEAGMNYHFFFYFLIGNLEFLGWPLTWAINIPSIISFASLLILLYVLAVVVTRSRWAGVLTLLLFLFRSSWAIVTFLKSHHPESVMDAIQILSSNTVYLGSTAQENWGIWNLNVYINQRHLAFAIALLLVIIISVWMNLTPAKEEPCK